MNFQWNAFDDIASSSCSGYGPTCRPAKLLRRLLLIIGLLSIILIQEGQAARPPRVLVLNSYHPGFTWSDNVMEGIRAELEQSDLNPELTFEYMDTKQNSPETVFPALEQLYRTKYQEQAFDVIIVSDNNGLDFLLERRQRLFPGVPIVFCGLNNYSSALLEGQTKVTGVAEDFDVRGTLQLMLRLHPELEQVAVISDATTSGKLNLERIAHIIIEFQQQLEFLILSDVTAQELQAQLRQLPEQSAILYLAFYRDHTGATFSIKDSVTLIREACDLPIYSVWDYMIVHGVLGGIVTSGRLQGENAARMTLRILRGESADHIPVRWKSSDMPMFDYRQLARFGLSPDDLPSDSVILHEPESLYYQYKHVIWIAAGFVLLQTVITVILGVNIMRRKMAEKSLTDEQNLLRALMDASPDHIYFKDRQSRFIRVNHALAEWHGAADPADTIRKTDFDFFADEHARQAYQDERQIIQTGQPLVGIVEKETWKNRQATWVSTTKVPFRDANGQIIGVIGISRDITADKLAEAEKNRLLERTQRQNATLVQLATHPALTEGRLDEALPTITQAAGETLDVDYVHICRLDEQDRELHCLEAFSRLAESLAGCMIPIAVCPRFFEALQSGQVLEVGDASTDLRTAGLLDTCWAARPVGASLNAPIRLYGSVVGFIGYDTADAPRTWTTDEVSFAGQIASLAAQVFLTADLRRQADQLAAITSVSHEITALFDLPQMYHSIARHASELSGSDASGVFTLHRNGRLYLEVGYGVRPEFIEGVNAQGVAPGMGAIGQVAEEYRPVEIPDRLADKSYPYNAIAEIEQIRSILAVPMMRGDVVIGGVVLWHRQPRHYSPEEVTFIQALAQECVNAVENARLLEAEARGRREADTLRMATQALSSTLNLQEVFELILSELHRVVPYDSASVQQLHGHELEIIGGHGFPNLEKLLGFRFDLTAQDNPNRQVVERRSPVILDDAPRVYDEFHHPPHDRANIHSWLGVPLLFGNRVIGMLALDKQETGFYSTEHARLALAFANQAAIAIENARIVDELKQAKQTLWQFNEELEQRVEERTLELQEMNTALQDSLTRLQRTQEQLVQAEKMAALGGLVAGVSHEISTPVGIGVTAASHLEQQTRYLSQRYQQGQMTRSDLETYLKTARQSADMILGNLRRAAEHIRSFKQVAVDQTSGERRSFKLKDYLDELMFSLHPKLKKTPYTIRVSCPDGLRIVSYPGAFSQIITNFVLNSLTHGFEQREQGQMSLEVSCQDQTLHLQYSDDGNGMTADQRARVFEPFFTTKRGKGGTGLGLHIVYNLVTQRLGGQIECYSAPGNGTTFLIQVPLWNQETEKLRSKN